MLPVLSFFVLGAFQPLPVPLPPDPGEYSHYGPPMFSTHPAMCLARVNDKGGIAIRSISGMRTPSREMVIKKKNEKGELVDVKIAVGRQKIDEYITTVPTGLIKLYDTDGKAQDAAKLADLLRAETPVLVIGETPDVKFLTTFRKDLPVLSVPPLNYGYGPPAAPPVLPKEDPKPKPGN